MLDFPNMDPPSAIKHDDELTAPTVARDAAGPKAGPHRKKILIRKLQLVALPLCCLTLSVLICEADVAFAQEVTATITGTITDQSDATIAGANVTAKSVDRGTTFITMTNDSGLYRISQLPVAGELLFRP